jgi:3-dehydroquinate synthetase
LLQRFGFETALPLPVATLADAAVKDKKRAGDALHIILPTAIGSVCDRPIGVESVVELLERV